MKQKVIQSITGAINAAQMINLGITELGATVNLPRNPQADIVEELTNTIMACGNHEQAKQVKATRRNALVDAINEAQDFVRVVRDVLKLHFGNLHSTLWTALGFGSDSLAVTDVPEVLKRMLLAIIAYLTANPAMELGAVVTAARAQLLHDALEAAQHALMSQGANVDAAMNVRDEKYNLLRKRITNVFQELRMELDPFDPRWKKFGFYLPGADGTPDQVEGVLVALIGATTAAVRWDASARAGHYRVWYRVHGSTADYIDAGSPVDLDFTIENLPAASAIDIVVTAVNSRGESRLSQVVTVTTH